LYNQNGLHTENLEVKITIYNDRRKVSEQCPFYTQTAQLCTLIASPLHHQFQRKICRFKGNILNYNISRGLDFLPPQNEIILVLPLVVIEMVIFWRYNMEG
jgi:hypothetical protein